MRPLSILVCIAPLLALVPASVHAQQQASAIAAPAITPATGPAASAPSAASQGPRELPSIVQPSFVLRGSVGGVFGSIGVGRSTAGLHYGARGTLYVGHDLFATGTRAAPFQLSVGYLGSLTVNHLEVLHRHGAAFSLRTDIWLMTLGGGLSLVNDYATRSTIAGGHIAAEVGFQWGNFTMTLPFNVDFFRGLQLVTVVELGLTLGVATN